MHITSSVFLILLKHQKILIYGLKYLESHYIFIKVSSTTILKSLKGLDTFGIFSAIFYRGDNFMTSCLLSKKRGHTKRKEFAPYLLKKGPMLKGNSLLPRGAFFSF